MKRAVMKEDAGVDEPPITPFIDVVFQLLIFFMLTLQFSDASIEKLVLPQAYDPKTTKMSDPTLLIINIMKDGMIKIGGKVVYDPRWATSTEKERGAFTKLEELFNKRRSNPKYQEVAGRPDLVKYFILIRADRSTDFEHIQRLLMMATRYGGVTKVMFACSKGDRL